MRPARTILIMQLSNSRARELSGYNEWPNSLLGFGALCVKDSLPL